MAKTAQLVARVHEVEKEALRAIAEEECLNLSEATRFVIREVARERGLWPPGPIEGIKVEGIKGDPVRGVRV